MIKIASRVFAKRPAVGGKTNLMGLFNTARFRYSDWEDEYDQEIKESLRSEVWQEVQRNNTPKVDLNSIFGYSSVEDIDKSSFDKAKSLSEKTKKFEKQNEKPAPSQNFKKRLSFSEIIAQNDKKLNSKPMSVKDSQAPSIDTLQLDFNAISNTEDIFDVSTIGKKAVGGKKKQMPSESSANEKGKVNYGASKEIIKPDLLQDRVKSEGISEASSRVSKQDVRSSSRFGEAYQFQPIVQSNYVNTSFQNFVKTASESELLEHFENKIMADPQEQLNDIYNFRLAAKISKKDARAKKVVTDYIHKYLEKLPSDLENDER